MCGKSRDLTLTNVVFESKLLRLSKMEVLNLTLTNVVFESPDFTPGEYEMDI